MEVFRKDGSLGLDNLVTNMYFKAHIYHVRRSISQYDPLRHLSRDKIIKRWPFCEFLTERGLGR